MIIIIGGSSHVGKTYLSQKLMERLNIPYTSLDHIKMGLIRSGMTKLTTEDDYEMRYFMWPMVSEMIKTAIENDQNMILEGCYVPGEWKESFSEEYLKEIHCVFIVMSEEYIRRNKEALKKYESVIEKRLYDEELDYERLIKCSKDFKEECIKYETPCLEICNDYDIDSIMEEALKLLQIEEVK